MAEKRLDQLTSGATILIKEIQHDETPRVVTIPFKFPPDQTLYTPVVRNVRRMFSERYSSPTVPPRQDPGSRPARRTGPRSFSYRIGIRLSTLATRRRYRGRISLLKRCS